MGRRFLPALRGTPTSAATVPLDTSDRVQAGGESKVVTVGFASSVTMSGVNGYVDAAAGWDMQRVVTEGYERSVWTFRSVEAIAGHASRLPFAIGRNLGEDDEENLDTHPLLRVLNRRANSLEKGRHFRKRLSALVLLSKRGAFVEVTKNRVGDITRLDLLAPDRCRPVPDPTGDYLSHFEFTRIDGLVREIAPERVRWIREPHPTDPFSGVTPLEAAGLSVELDFLSRYYNVDFIKSDGRPGGILGVDVDGLPDEDVERLERKFAPGTRRAGQVDVLGTGPGGAQWIDTSARPRDMAYEQASNNSKLEILSAFGVPESVIGSAANRTFDNAEQEKYNFWTETMIPHLELIATSFEEDVPEEWAPYIDTSDVEVLELPRRQQRQEARDEVDKGLRSIDEYRPFAGLDPIHSPQTRALWVSPAKAPIAARPEDAAALGVAGDTAAAPGAPGAPGQAGGTAADAVQEALAGGSAGAGGSAADAVAQAQALTGGPDVVGGSAAQAVADAQSLAGASGTGDGAAHAAVQAALQTKTAEDAPTEGPAVDYDPGDGHLTRTELAVSAALDALLARQAGVIAARLDSPKIRKGTRFWDAAPGDTRGGQDPVDGARVVDEERWAQETQDALAPIVQDASTSSAFDLLAAFATAGAVAGVVSPGDLAGEAAHAAAGPAIAGLEAAVEAVRGWTRRVRDIVDAEAVTAGTVTDVVAALKSDYAEHARGFAEGVAVQVAQAAVTGAQHAAAETLTPLPGAAGSASIVKTWLTRGDGKVRDAHRAAAGQTVPVHERFTVGDTTLRYPGDPFGSPGLTRNCRCRAAYRSAAGATFLSGAVVSAGH